MTDKWQPIETAPEYKTVLTQHKDDLFPVCACRVPSDEGDFWFRIIEGPEDVIREGCGDHGALYRTPTHWKHLDDGPPPQEDDGR